MHEAKRQHKVSKSFIIAIGIALFFWLLTKLSKEYQTVVSFPVEYVNIPLDKRIQESPTKTIDIQIKASGFKLLSLQFFKKEIQLDASKLKRKTTTDYYFLIESQKIDIQNQVSNNYTINHFVQDTIHLNLGQLKSKKLPVKGNFDLNFKLGYHLTKPISIKPDSVLVSGPEAQINKLQELRLEKLTLVDVSESFKQKLQFENNLTLIKYNTKEVEISGEVDRFTEGSLEVPFTIINLPENTSVNTFPKTVKVVFQVGLSNFNKISASSFRVICDYKNSADSKLNYLIPKVIEKPAYVTSAKLTPNKVEFLIQK